MTAIGRARQAISDNPNSPKALVAVGDQLAGVLTALANPAALRTDNSRILAPVPIVVPPHNAEGPLIIGPVDHTYLPYGIVTAHPTHPTRPTSDLHIAIEDPASEQPPPTPPPTPRRHTNHLAPHPHQPAITKPAWEQLGIALTTIATGYHHPHASLPPTLHNGGTWIGRRLADNLHTTTHWRTPLTDIRQHLINANYIQTITVTTNQTPQHRTRNPSP